MFKTKQNDVKLVKIEALITFKLYLRDCGNVFFFFFTERKSRRITQTVVLLAGCTVLPCLVSFFCHIKLSSWRDVRVYCLAAIWLG